METNPYEYDRIPPWTPQQNQFYQNKPAAALNEQQLSQSQNQKLPQSGVGQKPGTQVKMPKARALALAITLKRTLAVASIVGFGMFGGLVAMHQVGTIDIRVVYYKLEIKFIIAKYQYFLESTRRKYQWNKQHYIN